MLGTLKVTILTSPSLRTVILPKRWQTFTIATTSLYVAHDLERPAVTRVPSASFSGRRFLLVDLYYHQHYHARLSRGVEEPNSDVHHSG